MDEIPVSKLRLATPPASGSRSGGTSSSGENPMRGIRLPARSFTELEFAVRASMDAAWDAGYDLRLTTGQSRSSPAAGCG